MTLKKLEYAEHKTQPRCLKGLACAVYYLCLAMCDKSHDKDATFVNLLPGTRLVTVQAPISWRAQNLKLFDKCYNYRI